MYWPLGIVEDLSFLGAVYAQERGSHAHAKVYLNPALSPRQCNLLFYRRALRFGFGVSHHLWLPIIRALMLSHRPSARINGHVQACFSANL